MSAAIRALIIGSGGQLGQALQKTARAAAEVIAPLESECDLTDVAQLTHWLDEARPNVVFNAAAYTAVDAAEQDVATAELVNGTAVANLAEEVSRRCVRLVHVSTDFVFDGTANLPIKTDATPNPINVYGRTKLDGERAALSAPGALVVRTAWVYDSDGRNFVRTMLQLMEKRDELHVVADQVGTPTCAADLAVALWALVECCAEGIYHFTNEGVASWYDFAVAIEHEARAVGLLTKAIKVLPIATADYPTPAKRPQYSVLDKSKTHAAIGVGRHWRDALRETIGKMK